MCWAYFVFETILAWFFELLLPLLSSYFDEFFACQERVIRSFL